MKKPKTPFRSALRGQIRKMLSIVGRNRQSRLNPTTRQQCYDIFALSLVIVIIVSIVVLLVQNLVSFPQIFFSELSGFCAFLAPSVRDHLSRLSPDNFIFLIPVRPFSFVILSLSLSLSQSKCIFMCDADDGVLASLWIGLSGPWTFDKTSLCIYVEWAD